MEMYTRFFHKTVNWRTNTIRDLSMEELMPRRGSDKDRYELYTCVKSVSSLKIILTKI